MDRHISTSALNFGAVAKSVRQTIVWHLIGRMKPTSPDYRAEVIHVGEPEYRGGIWRHVIFSKCVRLKSFYLE